MTFAQGAKGQSGFGKAATRPSDPYGVLLGSTRRVSPCEVVGLAKRDRDPYPCPRIRAMVLVEYE